MKRVACLYRVSTTKQLDENDIPMQKKACRDFINQHKDWQLVKEYYEKGVSGYKVSAVDRDELQRAKIDAENKQFDILLVYMFDRLGRKEDETPFVVEYFNKIGVEVWSVIEGKQEFNSHVDKLINYIRFWQSNGESQKTSIRVDTKHKQMVEEGLYRGGTPPFGYKLVKSGLFGKKGNELHKLAVDENEAKIVQTIFYLAYYDGYGTHRIAQYLNKNNMLTRSGCKWGSTNINNILKNPIYIGYITYGKTTKKSGVLHRCSKDNWIYSKERIPELQVISDEVWYKVQEIRKARSPFAVKNPDKIKLTVKPPAYGSLLFTGFIYCGYCGSALTTTYHYKEWERKDGTIGRTVVPKYRCNGKTLNKVNCEGQATYGQKKIEGIVMEEIYNYLDSLKKVDFSLEIEKYRKQNLENDIKELNKLNRALTESYKDLDLLNNEILKVLKGESKFSSEKLNELIEKKEKEIKNLNEEIKNQENLINSKKITIDDMSLLKDTLPSWKEVFDKADIPRKKMMLSTIIDKIIVYRDKIDIHVKLHISQFLKSINGDVKDNVLGEQHNISNITKILERLLTAKIA